MTDLDDSRSADGGARNEEAGRPGTGPMPFFPAPPGRHATPPSGMPLSGGPQPLSAPTMAPPMAPPPPPPPPPGRAAAGPAETGPGGAQPGTAAVVKGRITIEDEVVEKVAALAALEVPGVAALSERAEPVRVQVQDNEVAVDLAVVVEYGCVVMDVARQVKTNVARVTSRMLGMRVTAVNVVVDDVFLPEDSGVRAARG
ncbi:Asp23/Gls24 family envelope stress response protein [Thermomonospora amylolytica]|uniref:Asp23/Gls24 family envelope stress response protein n=1 Tax=Thermomonospora amylolytica TaxID=1411117 RepID=UPI0018E4FC22|nr:Asp23/Gls24 family envelope stress response protein [Thermomonospora amylolytica]